MALLKDLTVFGATNLISDTFANNIWSNGYHHNAHDNNDSVLLAGGGYKAITTLLSGGFWANQAVQNASSTATTPQFGAVGINAAVNSTYKLYVSGDTYTTAWSRAASGFYCHDTGVHYTHNSNNGEINVTKSNEFIVSGNATTMYINYRAASRGTIPTTFIWNGGSSTTYATHKMKAIELFPTNNSSYSEGLRIHQASNNWNAIVLCGADNTAATGTSANTWGIYNNNGVFSIAKNASSYNGNCAIGNSGGTWYINNRLTINSSGQVAPVANYYNAGMYGNYDSTRLGHIWSIGTGYYMNADAKSPNTAYGMLYFHTNWSNNASYNTANASKTALGNYAEGHQIGFFNNGVLGVSIGLNGNIYNKGWEYANGFKHSDHNNNNAVLLAGGGWSLISDLKDSETVTITKLLTVTEEWMDTGILINNDTFPLGNGTYAIQIVATALDNATDLYDRYYSGIMSVYTGATDGENSDEIVLHNASKSSIKRLYLRTTQQLSDSVYKLQIAAETDYSTSYSLIFKFRKLL